MSFAILIGLVGDTISDKIENLRRGKNPIIESGHVLIIGWSEKIFCFLENMAIANESEGGMTVVILASMAFFLRYFIRFFICVHPFYFQSNPTFFLFETRFFHTSTS